MANFLGVDHGTQGLRFCKLKGRKKSFFGIERTEAAQGPILDIIKKEGLLDVDLIGLSYSMGDAINSITEIGKVKDRGQKEEVTGEYVGGGTRLFDEIASSGMRAFLIPGLHRGIGCLDRRFRLLYSHMAASEKVALSYHAFLEINNSLGVDNLLISDISSNTVTIGIKEGRFFGAIDACLGSPGLFHGPLDLESIRSIDRGNTSANSAFYSSGLTQLSGLVQDVVLNGSTEEGRLARDALLVAVEMEIVGLSKIIRPQAIAVSGYAGINMEIFSRLKKPLVEIAPLFKLGRFAAAEGAAEIARDIARGKKDFLGIGVKI